MIGSDLRERSITTVILSVCLAFASCSPGPSPSAPSEASALEARIDFLEGLLSQRRDAARFLDELTSALPERVWLTELAYEAGEASVKGVAGSNILLFDYLSRLEGSAELANVGLKSSTQRAGRDRDAVGFVLLVGLGYPRGVTSPHAGPSAARLEELEKQLLASGEKADLFRQMQRLASDAGLQMTKFAPEGAVPAGPYEEWSAAIEVMGDVAALQRLFRELAGSARLWVVEKFSFKTLAADDSRSPVRASIAARTFLLE